MKHWFYILLIIALSFFSPSNTNNQLNDCKYKNIELKGRVRIVTFGADFRIKVVESQPDLRVKKVAQSPVECGEWQFVDSGEDFTVEFVESFPDFMIKYVEVSPGMN